MRESARPTGVSFGAILATPISSSGVRPGAWVRRARKQATCGRPMPTTTVCPSLSSRAPAAAMISVARISISVTQLRIGQKRLAVRAGLGEIGLMVCRAAHVSVEIGIDAAGLGMADIGLEMAGIVVVTAIDGGGVGAEGLMHHRLDPVGRNDGAF